MTDETISVPNSTKTVEIRAAGRTFVATPEEFHQLRERLNQVTFEEVDD